MAPAPTQSAQARQVQSSTPSSIVVIGDSNVEGRAVAPQARYPAQLEFALRNAGYNVTVVNRGIYGDRIRGVLRRLDRDVPAGTRLAVVWVGINDARYGATLQQVTAGLAEIRRRLSARGIANYIVAPPVYDVSLHRNRQTRVSFIDPHLNARGYSIMLQRTWTGIRSKLRQAGVRPGGRSMRNAGR
ncbi:MAG: SGNH/GDSL hydrolase family protein [Beijerinckiaceae bacterium]